MTLSHADKTTIGEHIFAFFEDHFIFHCFLLRADFFAQNDLVLDMSGRMSPGGDVTVPLLTSVRGGHIFDYSTV